MMDRRTCINNLTRILLAVSLAAKAQQPERVRRIGFLAVRSRSTAAKPDADYDAFTQAMGELGYVEGKNLLVEWRYAEGKYEAFPAMATELARMQVEAIVTEGTPATLAAQRATKVIPIVTATVGDPVQSGFAASLGRPGSNITGLSSSSVDLGPKQVELLRTVVPKMSRLAVLTNPGASHHPAIVRNLALAAKNVGVTLLALEAQNESEIARAFASMPQLRADAVVIASDAFFSGQQSQIAAFAAKYQLPSIYTLPEYARAGGLLSYGQDLVQYFRYVSKFVDKILKGAKPSDLPFEQPTRFELVINLKAAKALGLTIPQSLLLRADEVIQ